MLPWDNDDVRRIAFDESTADDHVVLAGIEGARIRVVAARLHAAGAVDATFGYGATPTPLEGAAVFDSAGSGYVLPGSSLGYVEAPAGEDLVLTLSAAVAVTGVIVVLVG